MELQTEEQFDTAYPTKTHLKRKFSFDEQELQQINKFSTAYMIAKMLEDSANVGTSRVIEAAAERLKIKRSPAIHILPTPKEIIVYEPKTWCSECDNAQATHKFGEKIVCESCATKLQEAYRLSAEKKTEEKIKKETKPVEEKK